MSWNWLTFWRRYLIRDRKGAVVQPLPYGRGSQWNVVMYTRQGCHLCEQAWRQLEQAQQRYRFTLRQVDIDADAQLTHEYGECVPVVVVNGRVRFRGMINRVLLKRLLEGG
jgi:glutaredoxin